MIFIMEKLQEGYTVRHISHNTFTFTIDKNVKVKDFFVSLYYTKV